MIGSDIRMSLYLFTEELNQLAIDYSSEIITHFKSNTIITNLVNYAKSGMINPTIDELSTRLRISDVNPMICDSILETYKDLDRSMMVIDDVRRYFRSAITTKMLDKASSIQDSEKYMAEVARINSLDFGGKSKVEKSIKRTLFKELDIEQMKESLKNAVPSFWDPINKSNPYNGYRCEQLIAVCGGPGSGKSLFLMQEMLQNLKKGRKCIYCAIGDLIEEDFIVRLAALAFSVPISDIFLDLDYYKKRLLDNFPAINDIVILFIKPGKLSAYDLREYLESDELDDSPTTIFIDYDSNLNGGDDNLYQKGNEIYCVAEDLAARPDYLVFIATQPKMGYYSVEKFGMEGVGESGRKNHISATIITIGKHPYSVNPVGYITIAKQRRGVLFSAPYFRDVNGEFISITENQKSELALATSRRTIKCSGGDAAKYEVPVDAKTTT